jgi:hypothetical protein
VFGTLLFATLGILLVQSNFWKFLYFIALATFIAGVLTAAVGWTFSGALNLGEMIIEILYGSYLNSEDSILDENKGYMVFTLTFNPNPEIKG